MGIRRLEDLIEISYDRNLNLESYLYNLLKTKRKKTYFFVCTVNGDGSNFAQRSFHKSELDKALLYIKKNKNKRIFIPTVLFETRERSEENVSHIRKIIIDFDIYKSEKYKHQKPEEVIEEIKEKFFLPGIIPTANMVTYSGGGFYLEWELKYTPGGNTLSKRKVIAKILFEMLKEYEPDAKSLDVVHVFGLADTINWKYGARSVVKSYKNNVGEYTLSNLSRRLPSLWDVWKKEKKIETEKEKTYNKKTKITPLYPLKNLAYDHITSIKQLIELRNGDMMYFREKALFFVRNAYHKLHQERFENQDPTLFHESYVLACEINAMYKEPLTDAEIRKATLNKKKLYKFSTARLNEWFDISLDEQVQIKVKTKDAKREKSKRQMRNLRGSVTREEYEQERKESKNHLLNMLKRHLERNPKAKGKELAALLGVTSARISQLKKQLTKN
ncbi:replication protein [Neobacillus sp. D3-1R]|uniref:replication protein n=1 Tax=Neobacillus sp. D3-1R TaxID=3445778 RepID=UPI003FA0A126